MAAEPWESARQRRLRVAELFLSLQGEGTRAGLPTVFLRLTACALRCRWCDTAWAFTEGDWREVGGLAEDIARCGVPRVCVTGGEPLLQPTVVPLVRHLAHERGLDVIVETGGDQDISILPPGVARILDVKLPGSGMAERMDPDNLARLTPADEVKLIVADRRDYEAARALVLGPLRAFAGPILLGPVAGELAPATLAGWLLEDRLPARLQLQLHKLVWPGVVKGV
ncbi:MAG: radical SAM protein [Acidobacteria bacterium]|nr:radical SAM protein [Acidobacteriota bacterium]